MTDLPILRDLGAVLLTATLLVFAARRAGAPTIVAYLVAGLLLGPATGWLEASESVELISELGIILLLFLVGLELSLDKVRDVGRVVIIAALAQILLTAAGGFGLSLLLGFGTTDALFLAVALTFSSTVVVVKLLDQKGDSTARYGRIAIGILLVQDVAVILSLTLLAGLDPREATGPGSMVQGLVLSLAGMGALVVAAIVAARYLLPRVMGWAADSLETLFLWSLAWCFAFVVAAEFLELSVEIGAFLAGISLAQLPYNHELRRRVHPLMNFFIAVFFVSLGLHMHLEAAFERWWAVLALTAFVILGKFLILLVSTAKAGETPETSFRTGISLAQISEFSFVFAALAIGEGYIDEGILSIIGAVGLLTIGGSSYLILADTALYRWVHGAGWLRPFGTGAETRTAGGEEIAGHVIVVGMNALGRRIVQALLRRGEAVVAIDNDPRKLEELPCPTVLGTAEHLSVLTEAGLERAKLLVSALQIEDANNLLAFRGRSAGVPTSIHAFDRSVVKQLEEIGVDHLIMSKNAGTRSLAEMLRQMEEARA